MTAPEVGVLLPMRLETRFVDRGTSGWRLRVRVVPDAVSISNRDQTPSDFELDNVEAMWRQIGSADLGSAKGQAAWRTLARLVGPETAAYLARTYPPVAQANGEIAIDRPQQRRNGMHAPQLHGLTPTLELWLARGGRRPALSATLTPLVAEIVLDLDDEDSTQQPWWTSFAEAVRVGMAAELDLGAAFPQDIDALYLVGIGGGDPGDLLGAQADSGRLGVVAAGSATSSVDGEPTISSGDEEEWRRLVGVRATQQAGADDVRVALAAPATLPGVVGGEATHRLLNTDLVGALWPALWGHPLANVWGNGSRADELGVWAAQNLVPEGPLPALRIDSQPYGLLPTTSLRRWVRAGGDPTIEDRLVPMVKELVARWADKAESLADPNGDALHQLARNPHATAYAWRWMMPTELASAVSFRYADPIARADIDRWWQGSAPTTQLAPRVAPARRLVASGWAQEVGIGLAGASRGVDLSTGLARLAGSSVAELAAGGATIVGAAPPWGRSVLTELARHALLSSAATVARNVVGQPRALVEPVGADGRSATQTEAWARRLQDTDLKRRDDAAVIVHNNARAAVAALATHDPDEIERALRAVLDTAADRIDPWATAIAWRRLQSLAAAPRTLGAYGWVDSPRPRTGNRDHRFVLAPSRDQGTVAATMRDRAVGDPDAAAWAADLTSEAVRGALRIAGEVRAGSHPAEALGRMVERIVGRPDVVDELRAAFPLTLGLGAAAVAVPRLARIRRGCNGVAVLDAATTDPARLQGLGVRQRQLTSILQLAEAVDALADLHVAEGALGLVQHRPALVSSSTSAAAGESPPPRFTFPQTPRTGVAVDSVVVVVLPDARRPSGPRPSPARLADPAVAAYLDKQAGPADGPRWTWTRLDASGQPDGTVTLVEVGLRPCDTVGLGQQNLRDVIVTASGAAALDGDDPQGPGIVRSLAAAIAGVPAEVSDLGAAADATNAMAAELAARYAALHAAAVTSVAVARAALVPGGAPKAQARELTRMARWGISPMSEETSGGTVLSDRLAGAADVLERRLSALPADLGGASVGDLVAAMTALVGPEAGYPIFGRVPAAAFAEVRADRLSAGGPARLDPDWLEVVAPVRPALARLEAAQLAQRLRPRGKPMRAWTSKPGDPWQTAAAGGVGPDGRLVAVFGPRGVLPKQPRDATPGAVAAAVIDRFAETIPDQEHIASVAFPHDLPTARAPQAVLLAVPPDVDQQLTTEVLIDIVAETRDLARARMTRAASVGASSSALHLAAFPATGRTGVDFGRRS